MSMNPRADDILEWLEKEIGCPLIPSAEALTKICRGNMLPVWKFLLERVKSEKTVEKIRRNLHVHGYNVDPSNLKAANIMDKERSREERSSNAEERGRRKPLDAKARSRSGKMKPDAREKEDVSDRESESGESRERALQERDAAEKEVARLRHTLERLMKEMKARMSDLSSEEGERQRALEEKASARRRLVFLEAYHQRCEQCIRILSEYWRRLHNVVERARESQRGQTWSEAAPDSMRLRKDSALLYATAVRGGRLSDANMFVETAEERSIRVVCETISADLVEKIRSVFPAYDGDSGRGETQLRETKLAFEVDGGDRIPEQVKETALVLLKNPQQLLQAMIAHTARVVTMITRETEKIDIRADAEHLRYRFENNRVTEDVSPGKENSILASRPKNEDRGRAGYDSTSRGVFKQLQERQTAHVQQFMATEDLLNKAAEAKKASDEILKRLYNVGNEVTSTTNGKDQSQYTGGLRQVQLEVWAKERELAGLKAGVDVLLSEVQRLKMMSEERRQAKEDLRLKWKKIEEFNARRMELESVYTALIHANMTAAASWEQHMVAVREHSTNTILPVCAMLQNRLSDVSDIIEREVTSFQRIPDSRLFAFPAFPQGLLDAVGASNSSGPEAIAAAQRNADLLAARAGAGDPSAISSINRVSSALQNLSGEGTDAGLVAVVESLQLFFQHKVSAANLLEDLTREINHMQVLRDLVNNSRMLLASANSMWPEYERNAEACAATAAEQEKISLEQWVPELKTAIQEAQKCLDNCKRVRGLVDEWWEQPAATAVDWITVDGQNVAAWLAHVKQLQVAFYEKQLL